MESKKSKSFSSTVVWAVPVTVVISRHNSADSRVSNLFVFMMLCYLCYIACKGTKNREHNKEKSLLFCMDRENLERREGDRSDHVACPPSGFSDSGRLLLVQDLIHNHDGVGDGDFRITIHVAHVYKFKGDGLWSMSHNLCQLQVGLIGRDRRFVRFGEYTA